MGSVFSLIPGLSQEDSGLLPGLLDKLLDPSRKKLDSSEITMLRGDTEMPSSMVTPVPALLGSRCPVSPHPDFPTHGLQVHRD